MVSTKIHYANDDVISEQNKNIELKYLTNKMLECKSKV